MAITKIVTPNSITVFANGKILVASTTHPNFKAIADYIKNPNASEATLAGMFDIPAAIVRTSNGQVEVRDDKVFYDGKELHSTLTTRMLAMLGDGFDISPLVNFLNKLMKNPSRRAVEGLYDFLEATHIPITPNGNFLAYKKVRGNYFDIHSGTIRNAPGDAPRVPRNQVDEDPDRTCSHGLHVCSASYLDNFGSCNGSNRVVIVEVDPSDVVAIPRDYNNAKMRCAGYKVVAEVPNAKNAASVFTKPVMSAPDLSAPAPVAAAPVAQASRAFRQTDVIRNIEGIPVRFVLEERETWGDALEDVWVAYYNGPNMDRNEYETGTDDLEDAIQDFKDENMFLVQTWETEARWLDAKGNLHTETVRYTDQDGDYAEGDKPEDYMLEDALLDVHPDADNPVFVNTRLVTVRWAVFGA